MNGSAEFAIDAILIYSGKESPQIQKGQVWPQIAHTVELYSQDYVFITLQPKQLLQSKNIAYPFDAGTWIFLAIALIATTLALIFIARKDESIQVETKNTSTYYVMHFRIYVDSSVVFLVISYVARTTASHYFYAIWDSLSRISPEMVQYIWKRTTKEHRQGIHGEADLDTGSFSPGHGLHKQPESQLGIQGI